MNAIKRGTEVPSGRLASLWRRGDTAPSQCYDTCNAAYQEYTKANGSADICSAGSSYISLSDFCSECLDHFGYDAVMKNRPEEPEIIKALEFCDNIDSSIVPLTVTGTQGALVYTLTTTVTNFPLTTATVSSTLLFNGAITTLIGTTTRRLLDTASSPPFTGSRSSTTKTSAEPTRQHVEPTQSQNNGNQGKGSLAWIAGPIVGGLAVIVILTALGFILRKRWRRRAAAGSHPAADSEQKTGQWEKPELDADTTRGELDGTSTRPEPPELHSNHLLGELEDTNATRQLQKNRWEGVA